MYRKSILQMNCLMIAIVLIISLSQTIQADENTDIGFMGFRLNEDSTSACEKLKSLHKQYNLAHYSSIAALYEEDDNACSIFTQIIDSKIIIAQIKRDNETNQIEGILITRRILMLLLDIKNYSASFCGGDMINSFDWLNEDEMKRTIYAYIWDKEDWYLSINSAVTIHLYRK